MVDTYMLNPQILPGNNLPKDEHRRIINAGIITLVAAALVGAVIWYLASSQKPAPQGATISSKQAAMQAQIAAMLKGAEVQATPQEINAMAAQLSHSPVSATPAQEQAMATQLRTTSQESGQ